MIFTVRRRAHIPEGSKVVLTVPSEVGIRLPEGGTTRNNPALTIGATGYSGDVAPGPILLSPGIGSFLDMAIDFSPRIAGEVAEVTVSFKPVMEVRSTTISVVLPGVISDVPRPEFRPATGPITKLRFDAVTETLVLEISFIGSYSPVTVVTPRSMGLRIPSAGVRKDIPVFSIYTNAPAGPIQKLPPLFLRSWPAIGSFEDSVELWFPDRARANQAALMQIVFRPRMSLHEDEDIILSLPGFQANAFTLDQSDSTCFSSLPPNTFKRLSWTQNVTSIVNGSRLESRNVTVQQFVTTEENVTTEYTCPSLEERNITMQIENITTRLQEVPVVVHRNETFEVSPGVFANVSCSHVEYEWQNVSSLQNITVVRSVPRTFFVTELKNLTREVNYTRLENYTVNVTYTEFQPIAQLRLTLGAYVEEEIELGLKISPCSGLRLPFEGVTPESQLTIEIDASEGPVLQTEFSYVERWGSFLNTPALSYNPPAAAFRTEINLAFTASVSILASSTVYLTLPSMNSEEAESGFFCFMDCSRFGRRWPCGNGFQMTKSCFLFSPISIPANSPVQIVVSSSIGIRLPAAGIQANDPSLTIGLVEWSRDGQIEILPTPIVVSQELVPFLDELSLSYEGYSADAFGTISGMVLEFLCNQPLQEGDYLNLRLPGFTLTGEEQNFVASTDAVAVLEVMSRQNVSIIRKYTNLENVTTLVNITELRNVSAPTNVGKFDSLTGINSTCSYDVFQELNVTYTKTISVVEKCDTGSY